MTTLVIGATGFIGRALVLALLGRGHRVVALARSPDRARMLLPADVTVFGFDAITAALEGVDAIVNLAGESIAGKRWTAARKQALVTSRISVVGELVAAMRRPVRVFVCASASGIYGDRDDEILDESSPPGEGFAADLCREWEAAARTARADRIVHARFGVVLGREGGALAPLARLARLGLAGPLGDGRQWVSWIHLEDAVGVLVDAIEHDRYRGVVCVAARTPIRQRDFASALAAAYHRRAILRTPRVALRVALGEAASLALASQRIVSQTLAAYSFAFPTIDAALDDLAGDHVVIARADDPPVPTARYVLATRTELAAPAAAVFPFFASLENLAALTPPDLAFEIVNKPPAMERDITIDYRLRIAGLPLRWRTRIERWSPGSQFVDSQERGPYRTWHHEHKFTERNGTTIMDDVVHYAPPLGPLGAIANRLFIEGMLRRIFNYRRSAIRLRFSHS